MLILYHIYYGKYFNRRCITCITGSLLNCDAAVLVAIVLVAIQATLIFAYIIECLLRILINL